MTDVYFGCLVPQSVRGVRTVAAFGIQPNVLKMYDDLVGNTYRTVSLSYACASDLWLLRHCLPGTFSAWFLFGFA